MAEVQAHLPKSDSGASVGQSDGRTNSERCLGDVESVSQARQSRPTDCAASVRPIHLDGRTDYLVAVALWQAAQQPPGPPPSRPQRTEEMTGRQFYQLPVTRRTKEGEVEDAVAAAAGGGPALRLRNSSSKITFTKAEESLNLNNEDINEALKYSMSLIKNFKINLVAQKLGDFIMQL